MFNVGGGELVVIALVALIVLGPERLPGALRQVGRAVGELKKLTTGFERELREAMADLDDDAIEAEARRRGMLLTSGDAATPAGDTPPAVTLDDAHTADPAPADPAPADPAPADPAPAPVAEASVLAPFDAAQAPPPVSPFAREAEGRDGHVEAV